MTFFIVVTSLLIERFFDWSHVRSWKLFGRYQTWVQIRCNDFAPSVLFLLTLLPPVILLSIVNNLLQGGVLSFIKLFLGLFVLVYCLGTPNFWAKYFHFLQRSHSGDTPLEPTVLNEFFIDAEHHLFGIVFWFICLGPSGALFYRLVLTYLVQGGAGANFARDVLRIMDWVPARLLALLFALTGNFTPVMAHWRGNCVKGNNEDLLIQTGMKATSSATTTEAILREGLALIDRSMVLLLVFLGLLDLIF